MVSFNVIWLLGWVCGGFSFGFGTDSGGYMVLVFFFLVADPVGLCWLGFWW